MTEPPATAKVVMIEVLALGARRGVAITSRLEWYHSAPCNPASAHTNLPPTKHALTAKVSSSSRSKSASAPGVSLPFVARLRSFAGCALPQSKAAAGSAAPVHLHSRLAHPGMEPSSGTASSALSEV